jgi:two-component system phosphate regulon sensor histidine kinase PhoR
VRRLGHIPARATLACAALAALVLTVFALWKGSANADGPLLSGRDLLGILALTVFAALAFAVYMFRAWTRPLRTLVESTHRAVDADAPEPPSGSGSDELALLAYSICRMRRRLRHQIQTLTRERDTITSLLSQLHEGVIVVDPRGRIAFINPAAVRLLNIAGATADGSNLIGRPIERCVPQHDLQHMLHAGRLDARPAGADERAAAPAHEANIEVELPDRKLELVARAADLVLGKDDREPVRHRFVVLTDITDLSAALQMKSDFVANASHELRTPLSTIRAAVETLLNMDLATEAADAHRFVRLIDRHSCRLADLVTDLLDLSRVESPLATHSRRPIDVPAFLAELRERFAPLIAERNIRFETLARVQGPQLVTAAYPLQLVLDNLVDNALKFTQPGGEVRVIATSDDATARFEVIDTGCGIPEADRRRVFERFYQVERARTGEHRGTGLGLSIVKHAVNVLGGEVTLHSRLGAGTHVTVTLPLDEPAPSAEAAHTAGGIR